MARFFARRSHVRRWLYPAIVSGVFATGCSGGGSGSASVDPPGSPSVPGTVPDPVVANPPGNGPGAATDTIIGLSWAPSSDSVNGYIIYYGPTADATTTRAVQLSVTVFANGEAPNYSFNAGTDLGLSRGDHVCFRLSSYKDADESQLSESACADI